MKNLYFLLFFFLNSSIPRVFATNYYVSSSSGNDGGSLSAAQNQNTPWQSLARVNAAMGSFKAGDQVLFKRGDKFSGTLIITCSGGNGSPVVFGAYGDGLLPELTGFAQLSGFTQLSGNIWEAAVPSGLSYMNTFTINGTAKAVGRYPNAAAANGGYLTYDSFNTNYSITDSKLAGQNWAGGQLVMRKTHWIIDRNTITYQAGTTLNYSSPTGYWGATGFGYFVQNHPNTLDVEGEWYYDAGNKKLRLFSANNPNTAQVQAGVTETLVRVANQSNISFQNLRLSGAMLSALQINSAQNIRISGCELLFSGKNAVDATGTQGLTVENSLLIHTGNNAISVNGGSGTVLTGNQIRATGMDAGMGDNGDGTYEGITVDGDNNLISNNVIDSTGYIALSFSGNNVTVKNNVVSNFTMIKDDGGGIYTWNNGSNPPQNSGRVVSGNIVLNGKGAAAGTDNQNKAYSHGIYMDDNAGQVTILGNTVANCATYGMYIHNAHDLVISQNTLYNNGITQLVMEHDNVAADKPIYNCTVSNNILFAVQAAQMPAEYKTKDNDIANFGTFSQNYYYRPINNDQVIGVLQQVNGSYSYRTLSVEAWKQLYGKDQGSATPAHNIPAFTITKITGSNQYTNGTFDADISGLYAYASAGNCTAAWSSGALDGGALKVSFSNANAASNNYGSVIIGIGTVTAGKSYRLRYSMLGGNTGKAITAYLRQSTGGYADLSARQAVTISGARVEKELVLTATATEGNASIVFDVPEQDAALYLDNVRLEQAEVKATAPGQYISFLYNTSAAAQSFATASPSYDAIGNSYTGNIKLNAFSSAVLVTDTASTVTKPVDNVTCAATGTIVREEWDNIGGTSIANIPLQTKATSTSVLTSFEGPKDVADNYGSRIRGYICPPQTGNYTFWLATDDAGELWLSTDDKPANKTRIANVDGWTNYREWTKYTSQKSVSIALQAGQKYYIEALQKEGAGGDNLSVQWQLPDATMETPIAGSHLSPYTDTTTTPAVTVASGSGSITRDEWDNAGGNNIADIPLQNAPTSTGTITSFEGPKDAADNYGSRIRGYVFPPQTGTYIFWIAADDAGELWLSTDDSPASRTRIANVDSWTNYREWTKYASQKSVSITLQAGKKYYIEALQKEGGGGDNLSVQWQLPDGSFETPIAGIHLSPYVSAAAADQTITFNALASKITTDAPFALSATASSGLNVSYSIASGPATISGNVVTLTGAGTVVISAAQAGNTSFNAAKTISQSFTVTAASTTCSATGTILREQWNNVSGNNLSDFSFQTTTSSNSQLTAFEGPVNISDNYASRIRGYICAPQTGNYTFWIAGDDAAELYVSTNDDPSNKTRIANLLSWTGYREWTKFASQKSGSVYLEAGKKYYIEAIHKQGNGGDNLSVQWQLPNGTTESPLPGKYLSPYVIDNMAAMSNSLSARVSTTLISNNLSNAAAVKIGLFVYPNPVSQQSYVEFTLPESGQTNIALYNTKGQLMNRLFSGTTEANLKNSFILNVQTLPTGVYMLHLQSGKNVLVKKIIVVK